MGLSARRRPGAAAGKGKGMATDTARPSTVGAHRHNWIMILRSERARPDRIRAMPGGWWFAIATVCFGAFMGQLDASIATLTYPALRTQFHAGLAAVSWVS